MADVPGGAGSLIDRILVLAREHLGMEVAYIGQVADERQHVFAASAGAATPEVRAGASYALDQTYCSRMITGEIPQYIPDTALNPVTQALPATAGAGIGAYIGVPIELADGSLYGTLCAVSSTPKALMSSQDVDFMRLLAGVAAWELDRSHAADSERLQAAEELRRAIESGEVTLYYQPQMELSSGRIRSVEALARWIKPDGSITPPDSFIPLATATGLDGLLTERVVEIAVAQAARWALDQTPLRVAVNVPAGVLLADGFARMVGDTLDRHGLSPVWLELELTESDVMRDAARAVPVLRTLNAMGIQLAIDDFGTGYSSLSYLRELEVDTVKVDKSFVIPLGRPGADLNLVKAMIDLAHNLGLEVVAEGVEDADTARLLRDLGCEVIQGYWLSRPVVPGAIPDILESRPMAAMIDHQSRASDPRFHRSIMAPELERVSTEIDAALTVEDVTRALVQFVVRSGGSVVPAELAGPGAIPVDLSMGASAALVVIAPEGSHLREEFEKWLPDLVRRAQVIGVSG